jgi:hypothetical protein
MISEMDNVYFRQWVANTVHAISGIWPKDWRGLQRQWPLTTAEIGVVACQEVSALYLLMNNRGSARYSEIATTNVLRTG